jgi:hypothetical protein
MPSQDAHRRPPSDHCDMPRPAIARIGITISAAMDHGFSLTADQAEHQGSHPEALFGSRSRISSNATGKASSPRILQVAGRGLAGIAMPANSEARGSASPGGGDDAGDRRVGRRHERRVKRPMPVFGLQPVVLFGTRSRRSMLPPVIRGGSTRSALVTEPNAGSTRPSSRPARTGARAAIS